MGSRAGAVAACWDEWDLMSTATRSGVLFCKSARILEMTTLARVPSFAISEIASRNLSEFG